MTTESPKLDITLPSIISGHADLVYAVPLLLVSLVLTFAGAFLTLDRTRSFASKQSDQEAIVGVFPSSTKTKLFSWWVFEGGIGGLCGAWAFAAQSVTLLTLFLANKTNAAPLSTAEFLVVYLLSSALCTVLAGRFKLVALLFIGLTGGFAFAMILSVVLHPSLVTRQVFVALFTPLVAIMSSLPINRTQHGALRFSSASSGCFGAVISITILAHQSSWQNVWERLWLPSSLNNDWGTGVEHRFSALACVLLVLGTASDWFLYRKFGENPDEKWNTYLSKYSKSFSNTSDRAGVFEHSKNWWERLLQRNDDMGLSTQSPETPDPSVPHSKYRKKKDRGKRFKVQFRPLGDYSDSDSESDDNPALDTPPTPPEMLSLPSRPWLHSPTSQYLSGPTLYGSDELDNLHPSKNYDVNIDYDSDSQDITDTRSISLFSHRDEPGWKPGFLKNQKPTIAAPALAFGAVPMTPSLLRAIDRIRVARSEVYPSAVHFSSSPTLSTSPPREVPREHDSKWQTFWNKVQTQSSRT